MVVQIGVVKELFLRGSEISIVGSFEISALISDKVAVLLGGGRINVLSSINCVLASSTGPIIVKHIHCVNLLAMGDRHPIIMGYSKANRFYARRSHIQRLTAREAYLGELCSIDEVESVERLVFLDPHTYVKRAGSIGEVLYSYKIAE